MNTTDLNALLFSPAEQSAADVGLFTIDAALVTELANALLVNPRDLTIAIRVLVRQHAGLSPAFEIRTGSWHVDLKPAAARAVLTGVIATSAMWLMDVGSVPVAVLAAVASLLFSVRSVELDPSELVLHAQLLKSGDQLRDVRELHSALPPDMREDLTVAQLHDVVERLHRAGFAAYTEGGIRITRPEHSRSVRLVFGGPSLAAVEVQADKLTQQNDEGEKTVTDVSRKIFVVHGRDEAVRSRMFDLFRAVRLEPQEWEPLVAATGSALPFLNAVVANGLTPGNAQAVVVLLTPDDIVTLHPDLRGPKEPRDETAQVMQARPNVLIELGMALSAFRNKTVIVELGQLRRIADLDGLNVIRFNGSAESISKLVGRLGQAGCPVNTSGTDWLSPQRFADLEAYDRTPPED